MLSPTAESHHHHHHHAKQAKHHGFPAGSLRLSTHLFPIISSGHSPANRCTAAVDSCRAQRRQRCARCARPSPTGGGGRLVGPSTDSRCSAQRAHPPYTTHTTPATTFSNIIIIIAVLSCSPYHPGFQHEKALALPSSFDLSLSQAFLYSVHVTTR